MIWFLICELSTLVLTVTLASRTILFRPDCPSIQTVTYILTVVPTVRQLSCAVCWWCDLIVLVLVSTLDEFV